MKKVTAWIMRGSLLQMACRSSTTTFRRDTATERLRAREELLSKGYAFLEDPISRATHAQFPLPVPRSRIAATPALAQRIPEDRLLEGGRIVHGLVPRELSYSSDLSVKEERPRPLLLHAPSKATAPVRRRVFHFLFWASSAAARLDVEQCRLTTNVSS
jgi:hypothetical protein